MVGGRFEANLLRSPRRKQAVVTTNKMQSAGRPDRPVEQRAAGEAGVRPRRTSPPDFHPGRDSPTVARIRATAFLDEHDAIGPVAAAFAHPRKPGCRADSATARGVDASGWNCTQWRLPRSGDRSQPSRRLSDSAVGNEKPAGQRLDTSPAMPTPSAPAQDAVRQNHGRRLVLARKWRGRTRGGPTAGHRPPSAAR